MDLKSWHKEIKSLVYFMWIPIMLLLSFLPQWILRLCSYCEDLSSYALGVYIGYCVHLTRYIVLWHWQSDPFFFCLLELYEFGTKNSLRAAGTYYNLTPESEFLQFICHNITIIMLLRSITVFSGTDNILQNILYIQFEWWNTVNPT